MSNRLFLPLLLFGLFYCFVTPAAGAEDHFSGPGAETTDGPFLIEEDALFSDRSVTEPKGIQWSGFFEVEQGGRVGKEGPQERHWILSNRRFRLATSLNAEYGSMYLKADFIDDGVTGESQMEIREGRIVLTPVTWLDISAGKQVNTWGVADMLFINDLFPKNWISNFLGRDMESMKESANSLRATAYYGGWSLDIVYHPEFSPDITPTGCRFAYYDPNSGQLTSRPDTCGQPNPYAGRTGNFTDSELSARLKRQFGSFEVALYGYEGFYKNPKGLQWEDENGSATDETEFDKGQPGWSLIPYYPELTVSGASVEGQLGPGIVSLETGYYDSREDRDGDNPLIENSKWKYLLGYRMDFTANVGFGLQMYGEKMEKYDEYEKSLISMIQAQAAQEGGQINESQAEEQDPYRYRKEEFHYTYTVRMTFKARQDTLQLSLFSYQRPQDKDSFTKIEIGKRLDNHIEFAIGVNVFSGEDHYEDREFGMLRYDDNAFARLKYYF
jgi:hypothetical protein